MVGCLVVFRNAARTLTVAGLALVALVAGFAGGAPHAHAAEVKQFLGSWQGSGRIQFKDGRSESIVCRSYNTGAGDGLRLALRCASAGYKIELRSRLKVSGGRVTGTWEERNFNAQGAVEGRLADDAMALRVNGGGVTGDIAIARANEQLSYRIKTVGMTMTGVSVALRPMR
ncbi:MAG: hypothetical protein AAFR23_08215 [Pseudomonadota bacterium]